MEIIKEFLGQIWPHWPGFMWIIIATVLAQLIKTRIGTVEIAKKSIAIFWLRRVFPVVILLMGTAVGAIWVGESSPGVVGRTSNMIYFTGCSAMSILLFDVFKQWVKKKYDVEVGLSVPPQKMYDHTKI